jgi:NADH:ubiquinone oxidoreductase subunit 3 (subunit A)
MLERILTSPVTAFALIFFIILIFLAVFPRYRVKNKNAGDGGGESYASGEDYPDQSPQPDYSQFFPVAFFFTILHVAALVLSTISGHTHGIFFIAIFYIFSIGIGLVILWRD